MGFGNLARAALPAIAAVATSACGAPQADAAGYTELDSAGVVIASSEFPESAAGAWRIAEKPTQILGEVEGAPEYLFANVRGALRLEHGTLVVADGGSLELRYYDLSGVFLARAGGRGEGPGEFSDIARIWRTEDGIAVESSRTRRVTRYGIGAQLLGMEAIPPAERARSVVGEVRAGRLLTVRGAGDATPGGALTQESLIYELLEFGDATSPTVEVTRLPGQRRFFVNAQGAMFTMPAPFEVAPSAAAGDTLLVFGTGREPQVAVYYGDGRLRRLVRWRQEAEPVTPALRDSVRDLTRERAQTGPPGVFEAVLAAMEFPAHAPAFSALQLDDVGRIWVRRSTLVPDADPEWHVLSPSGRWLSSVRLPPRVTLLSVRGDELLAVHRDELDVERVVAYRLDTESP